MKLFTVLTLIALSGSLVGCATSSGADGYSHLYEKAEAEKRGDEPVSEAAVERFIALYSPLDADYIDENLDQVYAEALYFNDTLATIYTRDGLREHLLKTADRLDHMSLDVGRRWHDGQDVFLQWVMETRFSILGSEREARTIGISQLRFDDQGRVIFHQDFWDSSQGFDQQLPVIGTIPRWLRNHP